VTTFRADMRAAAVDLLKDYADDSNIKLQVYEGRPRSIVPPTAFVDSISGTYDYLGPTTYQEKPRVQVIVLHALFDSKEAVTQADAFVDGFFTYQLDQFHAAGANTILGLVDSEDEPDYVPDWLPPEQQRTYYATRLTLEGLASGA